MKKKDFRFYNRKKPSIDSQLSSLYFGIKQNHKVGNLNRLPKNRSIIGMLVKQQIDALLEGGYVEPDLAKAYRIKYERILDGDWR